MLMSAARSARPASVEIGRLADKIISESMAKLKLELWSFDFLPFVLLLPKKTTKKQKKVTDAMDKQIDLKLIVLSIAVY